MSIDGSWGYMAGRWAADREANAQDRRARKAIASWKEYSEKLEGKYAKLEWKYAKAESEQFGFMRLYEAILEKLKRVDPNEPLLQRAARLKIFSAGMVEKASELVVSHAETQG